MTMMSANPIVARLSVTVEPYGDSAVLVHSAGTDRDQRRRDIAMFRRSVLERRPPGVTDVVSGLESVLVEFDPTRTNSDDVLFAARLIAELPVPKHDDRDALQFEVPIVVDEITAPDLAEVAAELELSPTELVDVMVSSEFTIALLAAAMAPMMEGLRVRRPVRRQADPRTDVPAGSIMIAGVNAIIQPFPGPSGWRVVGRTPQTIVDIRRELPTAFSPGDRIRFRVITSTEANSLLGTFLQPTRAGVAW